MSKYECAGCGPVSMSMSTWRCSQAAKCARTSYGAELWKDTHGSTVRFAPPLVATEADIVLLVTTLRAVLEEAHR